LDKHLIVQFKIYFERISHGDLGISVYKNKPVRDIIAGRFGATLSLMIPAAIISILLGVIIGTGSAIKHGKPVDRIILIGSTLGFSLPNFFLGVLLIFTFSVGLGILPSSGNTTARHYVMPLATLVISEIAVFTRFTRASMIDILQRYYVISFRSLGIKERRILFFQALPNAAIALLTIAGFYIGSLVGGAIITETIFSWPGIGSLLIEAIRSRDFPLVQGLILLFGVSIVIINLLVDIANSLVDPRVRKGAL
jgi:peptide/nickel transport system permease protein